VLTPLTFEGHNYYPVWSPDGETVAFTSETDSNSAHLGSTPSDGSGAIEILLATGTHNYPESWVGRHLVFREQDARTQRDIWVLPLEGDRTPRRLFDLPASQEEAPRISPDGRWLAFSSDLSGRYEIYVTSFPEPGARRPVSLDGGTEPVWSRDGRELFYRRGREMIVASVETRLEFRVRERSVLFEGPYIQWRYHSDYDVHPDGRHFVMVKPGAEEQSARLVVVLNWFEELERLMAPWNQR
jgi:Tol biopolymer transport system component